jgi:hypothetical protein
MFLRLPRRDVRHVLALLAVTVIAWPCSDRIGAAQPDCSRLADDLAGIVTAPDPIAAARAAGVTTVDGAVRVIVELEPDREIPADLPGIVEASYQQFVQVLVEPARLCELAGHAGVVAVRAPFPARPDAPPPALR